MLHVMSVIRNWFVFNELIDPQSTETYFKYIVKWSLYNFEDLNTIQPDAVVTNMKETAI